MIAPILRALRRDRRGVALIEFAFTLPILLILILFGVETANLGLAVMRVHQIAATTADNAARVRDSINEADVNEVLMGGRIVGERMDFASRGRIVLSSVQPNGNTSGTGTGQTVFQKILWQRCTGALNTTESQPKYGAEGKGASDNSLPAIGTAPRRIAATPGSVLIFAEVTYRYNPVVSARLLSTFLSDSLILRSEAAFTVRERAAEDLTNPSSVTQSVCTRYDL